MSDFEAVVIRDLTSWATDTVTLGIRQRQGNHASFLMPDGTWRSFEEGVRAEGHGIVLPAASLEAITKAIAEFQGHTSHADTEARVLREWLAVEQRRVDKALEVVA